MFALLRLRPMFVRLAAMGSALALAALVAIVAPDFARAQEGSSAPAGDAQPAEAANADGAADNAADDSTDVKKEARELSEAAQKKVDEIAEQVDRDETAQEYSAGLLQPIYQLAEHMSFSWFHWMAFAIMAAGVVSFALQLVLGKLVVLMHGGFSLAEIFSDALGLVISLVGLTLTTQAAAENSTFTESPFSVLSSAAVGVIAGFVFYLWGQSQEVQAARGRRENSGRKKK